MSTSKEPATSATDAEKIVPRITFIEHNGTSHVVEATVGSTLMQAAIDNMVPGIIGDCGGACSCATCHGYIEVNAAANSIAPKDEMEETLLDGALHVQANSRLTCQIRVTPENDGLIVSLPVSQF
jgi:ferredoxin, 2Fe-2S